MKKLGFAKVDLRAAAHDIIDKGGTDYYYLESDENNFFAFHKIVEFEILGGIITAEGLNYHPSFEKWIEDFPIYVKEE